MGTSLGGDGSTRVRPPLVYSTGKKDEERTKFISNITKYTLHDQAM